MTDKEVIMKDGKYIKCPCYIDRPLHRYDKGCLIQSEVFKEQQTEEKPILRCDEIKNCPIKENYKQLKRKEQECEKWKSYYDLYKQDTELIKKIHTIINSNSKYGVEFTATGIIDKDERISFLEIDEQIQLIFKEQEQLLQILKAENEELKKTYDKLQNTYIKQSKNLDRYKQTLKKIEDYCFHYLRHNPKSPAIDLNDIVKIINEVLKDE